MTHVIAQGTVQRFPDAIFTPFAKMGVDTLERRLILRQIGPLTADFHDLEHGIHRFPELDLERSSSFTAPQR